jgi:acyl-coenzyme A thioesterase PaaI-like protein
MPASLAVTPQEIHRLLQEVAFTRQYGFRLEAIAVGACTLFVPFQETFERPGGMVSGQVFMAAADVAMWLAIMTQLGITDGSVTVEMTTAFLQGAKREDFRCTATILRLGKRLVYGVAECVNTMGTRLSHHTLTYARPAQGAAMQA